MTGRRSNTGEHRSRLQRTLGPMEAESTPAPAAPEAPSPWRAFALGVVLASAAGVLDFIAFPGIGVWPLAFFALVPLFFALRLQRDGPRRGLRTALLGVLFGLVGNLGGFYWLVPMLEDFSGFSFIFCLFFAAVVCLFQGGMLALFAVLWARGTRAGWPSLLVAPAAFAAAEHIWPLLFPYYHGNHLHDVALLVQIADLGGPILVTALVVVVNAAVYEALAGWTERRTVKWRPLAVAAVLLGATIVYGALRIAEVEARMAEAETITVGTVQVSMGIFAKRQDPGEGLRRHIEDSVRVSESHELDLLIWPESAYTWFLPEGIENVKRLVSGPLDVPLLFGGLQLRTDEEGEERRYNTAFMTDGSGDVLGTYDKTYLLAFGEYLPFGDVFPVLYDWSPNSGRFTPGDHVRPLEWGDVRITALVCYEDILPAFANRAVREGNPHLLVNLTNDAWFGETTAPWQHLALAKMRAVEHHRYLVRSTNSGVSAIVDPLGRTVVASGVFTREQVVGDVQLLTGWTPYQTVGNWPGWLGLFAAAIFVFRRRGG